MNYVNFAGLDKDIRRNFNKISKRQVDVVVGVPRSGMVPAYIIALLLNVGCISLGSFIENKPIKHGRTRSARNDLRYPQEARHILVVDDSINTGSSIQEVRAQIPSHLLERVTFLAVYSASRYPREIDIFLKYLPQPRVFEWNIFGHHMLETACLDIDGVLCMDPRPEQNDDGPKYREFLLQAEPKFLPSSKVHALVTSRLEKYRGETEQWMERHGVQYDHLIMLDLPSQAERRRQKCYGEHKASFYRDTPATLFIESEAFQAREICMLSGKPVYCADENKMYNPGYLKIAANNPSYFGERAMELWEEYLDSCKDMVKTLVGYRES